MTKSYGILLSQELANAVRSGGSLGENMYYANEGHRKYANLAKRHTGSPLVSFPISDYSAYFTTDRAVYVAVSSEKDELTYLPTSRLSAALANGGDPWISPLRQSAKPGRVIKMLLTDHLAFSDRQVERVVNRIHSEFFLWRSAAFSVDFDVDILEKVYADSTHTASCRSGIAGRSSGYDQSNLGIAHVSAGETVFARALAWRAEDGSIFIDRQYGTEQAMTMLRKQAREAGYWHKPANDPYGSSMVIDPDGGPDYRNFVVKLDDTRWWGGRKPYFDTMQFLSETDPHVSLRPTAKTTHDTGLNRWTPSESWL